MDLLHKDSLILRQAKTMYPNIRWLLISGSPCQDLTFAGYLNGLLGLTGRRSMLFFVVYVVLRHAQKLFGFEYVRYLAENAGGARRQQHERRAPLGTIRTFSALSILPRPTPSDTNKTLGMGHQFLVWNQETKSVPAKSP